MELDIAPTPTIHEVVIPDWMKEEGMCHIFFEEEDKCLCGAPLQETATHYDSGIDLRCSGCGRLNCPRCIEIWKLLVNQE